MFACVRCFVLTVIFRASDHCLLPACNARCSCIWLCVSISLCARVCAHILTGMHEAWLHLYDWLCVHSTYMGQNITACLFACLPAAMHSCTDFINNYTRSAEPIYIRANQNTTKYEKASTQPQQQQQQHSYTNISSRSNYSNNNTSNKGNGSSYKGYKKTSCIYYKKRQRFITITLTCSVLFCCYASFFSEIFVEKKMKTNHFVFAILLWS